MAIERLERTGRCESADVLAIQARPFQQLLDAGKGAVLPEFRHLFSRCFRQALALAQANAHCRLAILGPLQAATPLAVVDVYGTHLDAMAHEILRQLRSGIESHRLAVQ